MATVSMQDRELLHTILKNVNEAQLAAHNSTRTFRNLLAIVALGIAVGAVLFPWIAGRADPSMLSVVGSSAATTSLSPVASGSAPPSSGAAAPAATSPRSTPPSPPPPPPAPD